MPGLELEDVLFKFDELNAKGDILATPQDKSIFNTIMSHKVDFVPIKGGQVKLRLSKYNKDINPEKYLGKYCKCILRFRVFAYKDYFNPEKIEKTKSLIIYLNHFDIV